MLVADEDCLYFDLVHTNLSRRLDQCNSLSLIAHITFTTVACINITLCRSCVS